MHTTIAVFQCNAMVVSYMHYLLLEPVAWPDLRACLLTAEFSRGLGALLQGLYMPVPAQGVNML